MTSGHFHFHWQAPSASCPYPIPSPISISILMAAGPPPGIFPYTRVSNQAYIAGSIARPGYVPMHKCVPGECASVGVCGCGRVRGGRGQHSVDYVYDWGANQPNVNVSDATFVMLTVLLSLLLFPLPPLLILYTGRNWGYKLSRTTFYKYFILLENKLQLKLTFLILRAISILYLIHFS